MIIFKSQSTNNFIYQCTRRPKFKGIGIFNINQKKFYITKNCDNNVSYNTLSYQKFKELLNKKIFNKIDFSQKKIQYLLIENLFRENSNFENIDIKKEFTKYSNNKFIVSNKEISYIKTNIYGKYKGLSLEEVLKKLENNKYILEIVSTDIKYKLKSLKSNKEIEKSGKLSKGTSSFVESSAFSSSCSPSSFSFSSSFSPSSSFLGIGGRTKRGP